MEDNRSGDRTVRHLRDKKSPFWNRIAEQKFKILGEMNERINFTFLHIDYQYILVSNDQD